jgi:hypothetical protein
MTIRDVVRATLKETGLSDAAIDVFFKGADKGHRLGAMESRAQVADEDVPLIRAGFLRLLANPRDTANASKHFAEVLRKTAARCKMN